MTSSYGMIPRQDMPVSPSTLEIPDPSMPGSPLKRLMMNPFTSPRIRSGISSQVPYSAAKTPPRSMSPTRMMPILRPSAMRRLAMSLSMRFISTGEPEPSHTIAYLSESLS